MDGLKVALQAAGDEVVQNFYYNGWKCDHFILNVFVFSPVGKICAAFYNAPGTMHDSTMAQLGSGKIDEVYTQTGEKVVVDSAF